MNKSELIKAAAARSGKTEADIRDALAALLGVVGDTVALDEKVVIPGFGTFGARNMAAQMRRNPATGESMPCPAKRAPYFKAGTALRATVGGQVPVQGNRVPAL